MQKEDAIKFCKYYKAEKENPYRQSPSYYIWIVERMWVNDMILDEVFPIMSTHLEHYIKCGFIDLEKFDDTPITLKAYIFSISEKWFERSLSPEEFHDFYLKWRNKEF